MDDTMTEAEWTECVEAMREAGTDAGRSAGSWIADGNTSDGALRVVLRQWEEGDPAAPSAPSPFSGEWGGDPTVEETIDAATPADPETLTPEEVDELASAYEDAFAVAWHEEAERTVRALLGEE
jgi:hypothetical protein